MIEKNNVNVDVENLELVHMFIVGSENSSSKFINNLYKESNLFRDIILIDTIDSYKNLIYKHLTAINWMVNHCSQALYMLKLDDDVFVNINPLSKHLVNKFGLDSTDSKFVYCSKVENALPSKNNNSKWKIDDDTYPFEYYPQYCNGKRYYIITLYFNLIISKYS